MQFFIFLTLFYLPTACGVTMATKFDWLATDSAPEHYLMQIVRGHFSFPKEGSLYIPNKKILHHGWGKGVSTHIVGDDTKPLPERLDIMFFSYTENQFYKGRFELPYATILKLFQQSYYSPKMEEDTNFYEIVAGIAPGGHVSVWVNGIDKTIEVFAGKADKIEGNWKEINDNPKYSRDEYIQRRLSESLTTEERQSLKQNGIPFGLWDTYRKHYIWQPIFTGLDAPKLIDRITYYNGEEDYMNLPLNASDKNTARPIPKEMVFEWEWPKGRPLVFKLFFNEKEIFAAFKKLSAQGESLQLEMRMMVNDKNETLFSVLLKNAKEEIFLKKTDLKNYGIPTENIDD